MSEDWLKQLYDRNYDMLYRLACNRLTIGIGHSSDVQDVLQEVFLLASKKKIYKHPKSVGWLVIATVNICNNYIQAHARRMRKYDRLAQEQYDANVNSKKQPIIQNADETQDIDLRIVMEQTLSDEEYQIQIQHYGEGLSLEEISRALNVSPSALRVRLHRIRKKLKKYFE